MFPVGTKILIIDDMKMMRTTIKEHLKSLGFSAFFEADNGKTAYQVLASQLDKREPIELVCCDWNMPIMTGLELLKKIRAEQAYAQLPFLFITAEREKSNPLYAAESGASGFINKPITTPGLQEAIRAVWKKHHP